MADEPTKPDAIPGEQPQRRDRDVERAAARKLSHTHTVDAVKFQTELVRRLAIIINNFKAQGVDVPPQLIEQFKAGVTKLIAEQAHAIK